VRLWFPEVVGSKISDLWVLGRKRRRCVRAPHLRKRISVRYAPSASDKPKTCCGTSHEFLSILLLTFVTISFQTSGPATAAVR
jgi:hypothetical protein